MTNTGKKKLERRLSTLEKAIKPLDMEIRKLDQRLTLKRGQRKHLSAEKRIVIRILKTISEREEAAKCSE